MKYSGSLSKKEREQIFNLVYICDYEVYGTGNNVDSKRNQINNSSYTVETQDTQISIHTHPREYNINRKRKKNKRKPSVDRKTKDSPWAYSHQDVAGKGEGRTAEEKERVKAIDSRIQKDESGHSARISKVSRVKGTLIPPQPFTISLAQRDVQPIREGNGRNKKATRWFN